jgi:hypothetical protein
LSTLKALASQPAHRAIVAQDFILPLLPGNELDAISRNSAGASGEDPTLGGKDLIGARGTPRNHRADQKQSDKTHAQPPTFCVGDAQECR